LLLCIDDVFNAKLIYSTSLSQSVVANLFLLRGRQLKSYQLQIRVVLAGFTEFAMLFVAAAVQAADWNDDGNGTGVWSSTGTPAGAEGCLMRREMSRY
jgi:hypothetical protein